MSGSTADLAAVAQAVNRLGARWAGVIGDPGANTVFAPVGVWPLLGLLAPAAEPQVAKELEEAVGMAADSAAEGARTVFDRLSGRSGLSAALGLWTAESLHLESDWLALLPPHAHDTLTRDPATDRPRLDSWARERTDGLIPAMPIDLTPDIILLLASAFVARTSWVQEFSSRSQALHWSAGPADGRPTTALTRTGELADQAAVLQPRAGGGQVTEVRVLGDNGIDVHLLLGEENADPATVLGTGIAALTSGEGSPTRLPAGSLDSSDAGPGMAIEWATSRRESPQLALTTAPFKLSADHDLLRDSEVFGLTTAADDRSGRFPGISRSTPLAVDSARQAATATFSATGFEAAAVTAIGMVRAAAAFPEPTLRTKRVTVRLDRPFAFLAVQRETSLLLAGGWVAEPGG